PPPTPASAISEEPVTDFDVQPQLRVIAKPKVPVGATGTVTVEVLVLTTGRVSRVRILTDSPYADLITQAAMDCQFTPALRRGRRVAAWATIAFKLGTNR